MCEQLPTVVRNVFPRVFPISTSHMRFSYQFTKRLFIYIYIYIRTLYSFYYSWDKNNYHERIIRFMASQLLLYVLFSFEAEIRPFYIHFLQVYFIIFFFFIKCLLYNTLGKNYYT